MGLAGKMTQTFIIQISSLSVFSCDFITTFSYQCLIRYMLLHFPGAFPQLPDRIGSACLWPAGLYKQGNNLTFCEEQGLNPKMKRNEKYLR